MTFEIIIPLRNPDEVLNQTIESLVAQSDRNFSVLISDNHSVNGHEHIERALARLTEQGFSVRKVVPPQELERVEHWNWIHYQSSSEWVKPLFAGDWLEPTYIARVHQEVATHTDCRYVYTKYYLHRSGIETPELTEDNWPGGFYEAAKMQERILLYGMQFGPPSSAAYERTAFIALGGYPTSLPITADCLFLCTLAAQFGAAYLPEQLLHCHVQKNRLQIDRTLVRHETYTHLWTLAYHAWTENVKIPVSGFMQLLARNYKI